MHLTTFVLATLLANIPRVVSKQKDNAILLSKVKSLTLRDGASTSHRRLKAIPQLTCVGGNACSLYTIDVMRCTNSGSEYDSEDISWTCKAQLPPEFKLGSTDVVCEGFDSPEDPFVLKGSCGAEYRLMLTDLGEEKYRGFVDEGAWRKGKGGSGGVEKEGGDGLASVLFWVVFVGIILAIAYSAFFGNRDNNAGVRRGYGGGGGGAGGDDGYDDPPPPYTPRAPKAKGTSTRSSSSRSSSSRQQQNQGWRPGFWTGTAAGAAAGYGASAWQNRNRQQEAAARPGPSNWFGNTNTAGPSNYAAGPSRSPPEPSSSRQESTGFGGTRRR